MLGSLGGKDVSAALFLHSGFELFYWLGGTLAATEDDSPSYPVIEEAIRFAADRGCRFANLGSSDGLPGAAFFKEGFGAMSVPSPFLRAEATRHRAIIAARRALRR